MAKKLDKQPSKPGEGYRHKNRVHGKRGYNVKHQLLVRRELVGELYRPGVTLREVAEQLAERGIQATTSTVYSDLEFIHKEMLTRMANKRQEIIAGQVLSYKALIREANLAWRRSQQNEVSVTESLADVTKEETEAAAKEIKRTTKGQAGERAFLAEQRSCLERIDKLLGLEVQPEEKAVTADGQPPTRVEFNVTLALRLKKYASDTPVVLDAEAISTLPEKTKPHTNGKINHQSSPSSEST